MNKTQFNVIMGNSPMIQIVDFFLDNQLSDYCKNEVMKNIHVSRTTFFKYWKFLERLNVVYETRKVGRAKMYKLNKNNKITKGLILLDAELCKQEQIRAINK